MFPSVASLPADISYDCTHNELFMCLERIINGSSLPSNVIDDLNPYKFLPSNLPGGVWFLINSNTCKAANHGLWKSREETFEVHSNSTIIGWKATLEYYDGQEPHQHKTNWVMEVFSITLKMTEHSKEKEASSLCKVFMNCEQSMNCEVKQKMPQAGLLTKDATIVHAVSKPKVSEDDKTRVLAVTARTSDLHVEGLHELVAHMRDGDYLELGDLDNPVSASSSSCNSSDLQSISSDEYFDSSAFLRELEYPGTGMIWQEKSSSFNFDVSEHCKTNEMVALPATLGNSSSSSSSSRVVENKNTRRRHKREHEDESPSSLSMKPTGSCSGHRTGKERVNKGGSGSRMKRLRRKYFCFLPF